MQTFDVLTYFSGMSAGFLFLTCLIFSLQLHFNIFRSKNCDNNILSHSLGIITLLMSCSTVCYIVYDTFFPNHALVLIGNTLDYMLFCMSAVTASILYSNKLPKARTVIALSVPFAILAIINLCFPGTRRYLLDVAILILILQYAYYAILLRNYEASLGDLFSEPDSHSLSWIRGILALFAGWWVFHIIFRIPAVSMWYDAAMYTYTVFVVIFAFIKINSFGKPISLETRKQVEQVDWSELHTLPDVSSQMRKELMRLLEEEQIYLDPDLTVMDVVKRLGTNTKYFSAMLHNDMHTTFCALINEFRIQRAKKLLQSTDDKIENIGMACGFNSRQSFCRTFSKITGKKPTDFRKL